MDIIKNRLHIIAKNNNAKELDLLYFTNDLKKVNALVVPLKSESGPKDDILCMYPEDLGLDNALKNFNSTIEVRSGKITLISHSI